MSTVNAAVRLRSLVIGIRPSLAYGYGLSPGVVADNLSEAGVEAWRTGLAMLADDLGDVVSGRPRDRWLAGWLRVELDRDRLRWSDSASMLRLLALALGHDGDVGLGRAFWGQWLQNLAFLDDGIGFGAVTAGSRELAEHCLDAADRCGAPLPVLGRLSSIAEASSEARATPGPFGQAVFGREVFGREVFGQEVFGQEVFGQEVFGREVFCALASEVERIYLADIVAVSFTAEDGCTAAQERFYNPDVEQRRPCTSSRQYRVGRARSRL